MHRSIVRIKCSVCDYNEEILTKILDFPPLCKCENMLRPDVVWFGESLPQDVWQNTIKFASQCDLMVIVGTSLVVSPANTLPLYAKQNNATLIEINPENTELAEKMNEIIRNTSAETLPKLISLFKK